MDDSDDGEFEESAPQMTGLISAIEKNDEVLVKRILSEASQTPATVNKFTHACTENLCLKRTLGIRHEYSLQAFINATLTALTVFDGPRIRATLASWMP